MLSNRSRMIAQRGNWNSKEAKICLARHQGWWERNTEWMTSGYAKKHLVPYKDWKEYDVVDLWSKTKGQGSTCACMPLTWSQVRRYWWYWVFTDFAFARSILILYSIVQSLKSRGLGWRRPQFHQASWFLIWWRKVLQRSKACWAPEVRMIWTAIWWWSDPYVQRVGCTVSFLWHSPTFPWRYGFLWP